MASPPPRPLHPETTHAMPHVTLPLTHETDFHQIFADVPAADLAAWERATTLGERARAEINK